MPTGRPPAGPKIVEKYEGSRTAKQRLRATLETIAGHTTVGAACDELGICPARFYVIRDRILLGALQGAEPRAGGRPRKRVSAEETRIKELEQETVRLEYALKVTEARVETALLLPRRPAEQDAPGSPKKTPRRRAHHRTRRKARSQR